MATAGLVLLSTTLVCSRVVVPGCGQCTAGVWHSLNTSAELHGSFVVVCLQLIEQKERELQE